MAGFDDKGWLAIFNAEGGVWGVEERLIDAVFLPPRLEIGVKRV